MRVLAILALALSLAGCEGDRTKHGMNERQAQPQSTGLLIAPTGPSGAWSSWR
ncbi:hypothetical protein [Bradyrhizobium erythrophlei]|uniref:Uncharacterized protein n=1 Tax=Bradyrhizobium erythrophlei TaxID=1437360 RepID=A0A1M5R292_9BRAD|nr:hypothetical protein [Bradyrhizobium erythrophlei]SHH20196.1 hypothetical protein SAMN05444169_6292 [Bradyrhizobium erythrophlei]